MIITKIKPKKGFTLIELLVSLVIITSITLLISSAFIGMMSQKRNLLIKETAEDMAREVITTVTRNSENLDLLLFALKTKSPANISGVGIGTQEQFWDNKNCIDPDTSICPVFRYGWPVDLTTRLGLTPSDKDSVNLASYTNINSSSTNQWLKFIGPTNSVQDPRDTDLIPDETIVYNLHPIADYNITNEMSPKFRFLNKIPSITGITPPITTANILTNLSLPERKRNGLFSLIDITSFNMKMKLLPKNTKVYLYIATATETTDPTMMEPISAIDNSNKSLILTAEVKYTLNGMGTMVPNNKDGSSVTSRTIFNPKIRETDLLCLGTNKAPSCQDCRTDPWSAGCNPCQTYNLGNITNAPTGSLTKPGSTAPANTVTCP